jgi:hypothetical protein
LNKNEMSRSRRSQRQQQPRQAPPFEISKSPEYRYIYASGVYGGLNPNDANLIFYLDRLEPEMVPGGRPGEMRIDRINRELQIEIHVSPRQFKSISEWMTRNVQRFEDQFGEISEEEEEDQPAVV